LLKQRLDRFTRVLRGVESGDARSLHRARVASRRLRELLPVLQLEPDVARKLGRRLRKVTRRLGVVREMDVLLELVEELQTARPQHRDALRRVGAAVSKSRDHGRKRLLDHLPADEMWRVARKLERVIDRLAESEARPERRHPARAKSAAWAIDARIAHRAARLSAAVQDAGSVYLTERLHGVRIALKKLRYAIELAPESQPDHATTLRTLKRVQGLLGRMHDLQVLIDRVREVQASLAPPNLAVWRDLDALVVALDEACRRLHARYVREREGVEAIASRLADSAGARARHTNGRERRAG
jgi:CHAD domain-containing protein